ncbi:MAG: hypothetical protein HC814_00795 [Rhodobacteraceae bacterium]|nr:hypothetical protein [Paracoccaceae bacterium]
MIHRRLEAVGGAVPLASVFYVERPIDREFKQAISRGDSVVLVKGARQIGKTSLLARGLQHAVAIDVEVVDLLGVARIERTDPASGLDFEDPAVIDLEGALARDAAEAEVAAHDHLAVLQHHLVAHADVAEELDRRRAGYLATWNLCEICVRDCCGSGTRRLGC